MESDGEDCACDEASENPPSASLEKGSEDEEYAAGALLYRMDAIEKWVRAVRKNDAKDIESVLELLMDLRERLCVLEKPEVLPSDVD